MPTKGKRKATEDAPREPEVREPVIFISLGTRPDVRLKLFGIRKFHVHSHILKHRSNYFRKFMDSADKTPAPPSAHWKYDYVSVVDEDGEWGLEVCGHNTAASANNNNSLSLPRTPETETNAFEKLLNAMYNKLTTIEDSKELYDMTRLADYYCALPVLSASLYASLWNSPNFLKDIRSQSTSSYHMRRIHDARAHSADLSPITGFSLNHPVSLLKVAAQLRHPVLFREMMVYVVSLWERNGSDWESAIQEAGLSDVVLQAYNRVYHLQATAHFEIFRYASCDSLWARMVYDIASGWNEDMFENNQMDMAYFFSELKKNRDELVTEVADQGVSFHAMVETLLKSKLLLDGGNAVAGNGDYERQFLCAEVNDEELPWDVEEIDW